MSLFFAEASFPDQEARVKTMKTGKKQVSFFAMLLALSLLLSYVESLLPIGSGWMVPGVKLGLPNLVMILSLYTVGMAPAVLIALLRILLTALLFGNAATLLYSLAGFFLSFLVMLLCKNLGHFSQIMVSVAGGISHNLGQILMAVWLLRSRELMLYFPPLFLAGTVAGFAIGLLSVSLLRRVKPYLAF